MSAITHPSLRIPQFRGDNVPMVPITDQPPAFEWEKNRFSVDIGKRTTHAWAIEPEDGSEVNQLTIMLQGWTSSADALSHLGRELVARTPGMAVVVFDQTRVPLPPNILHMRSYLREEAGPSAVGDLRANTAEAVGKMACKKFGLDELGVVAHSLGVPDGINMAMHTDMKISSMTALAAAGFLTRREILPTLWRAPRAICGPRKGFMGDLLNHNPFQLVSEAVVGLSDHVQDQLSVLHDDGVILTGIDFADDHVFIRHGRLEGFDDYHIVHDGCACHSAPTHPEQAPRITSLITPHLPEHFRKER